MGMRDGDRGVGSVLVLLIGLLLFASPFTAWWMRATPPWWLPFLLWLGLIGLSAWLGQRWRDES
jgi:membrane protein implicated in regulation of membrane protease activity